MIFFKTLLSVFFIYFSVIANGQIMHTYCHIYTVNFPNSEYYLKTVPYDNIEQSVSGKTTIYSANHVEQYSIDRYFDLSSENDARKLFINNDGQMVAYVSNDARKIFISNDGQTVAYVSNEEYSWDNVNYKSIHFYDQGKLVKTYSLKELLFCDSDIEECLLFYNALDGFYREGDKLKLKYKENTTDFEKLISENGGYIGHDSLHIFTQTNELLTVDMKTKEFKKRSMYTISKEAYDGLEIPIIESKQFGYPEWYKFPNLRNGNPFKESLADYLDVAIYEPKDKDINKYKRYSVHVDFILDSEGNAKIDKIELDEKISRAKLEQFINNTIFDTTLLPDDIEKWRFYGDFSFMNKSKRKAKKERVQELKQIQKLYQENIVADSINGVYIPKNIEEAFTELNRLLKAKDIEAIKNREDDALDHFGLGMWIRNNWGLWGGSRLQQYFIKRDINHPDSMSTFIMSQYSNWLNGKNDEWEDFDNSGN